MSKVPCHHSRTGQIDNQYSLGIRLPRTRLGDVRHDHYHHGNDPRNGQYHCDQHGHERSVFQRMQEQKAAIGKKLGVAPWRFPFAIPGFLRLTPWSSSFVPLEERMTLPW